MKILIIKSLDQCIKEKLIKEVRDHSGRILEYKFNTNNDPGLNYRMLDMFGKQYVFEEPNIRVSMSYYIIIDPISKVSWTWPKEVVIEQNFEFKKIKII